MAVLTGRSRGTHETVIHRMREPAGRHYPRLGIDGFAGGAARTAGGVRRRHRPCFSRAPVTPQSAFSQASVRHRARRDGAGATGVRSDETLAAARRTALRFQAETAITAAHLHVALGIPPLGNLAGAVADRAGRASAAPAAMASPLDVGHLLSRIAAAVPNHVGALPSEWMASSIYGPRQKTSGGVMGVTRLKAITRRTGEPLFRKSSVNENPCEAS